ncbi:MAG: hypothetical protein M1823_004608 [Watsoniomyces obsoletus]|nr:MAG: hypothetical protein M1823_004608 [Watsoniomyces obsoletus]
MAKNKRKLGGGDASPGNHTSKKPKVSCQALRPFRECGGLMTPQADPNHPPKQDPQRAAHHAIVEAVRRALDEEINAGPSPTTNHPATGSQRPMHPSTSGLNQTHHLGQLGQSLLAALEIHRRPELRERPPASGLPPLPPIRDPTLRERVFTHQGALGSSDNLRADRSYERLEFLGDAYLESIVSRLLYDRFPHLMPGRLSGLRQALVNNEHLARLARAYGFENWLKNPPDHKKPWGGGGSASPSMKVLADVFEAYIAAVILDAPATGLTTATTWLSAVMLPMMEKAEYDSKVHVTPAVLPKQELAKILLTQHSRLEYQEEKAPRAQKGTQTFFVGVYFTGWGYNKLHLGSGQGRNKGEAGNQAASQALCNRPLISGICSRRRELEARDEARSTTKSTTMVRKERDGREEEEEEEEDDEEGDWMDVDNDLYSPSRLPTDHLLAIRLGWEQRMEREGHSTTEMMKNEPFNHAGQGPSTMTTTTDQTMKNVRPIRPLPMRATLNPALPTSFPPSFPPSFPTSFSSSFPAPAPAPVHVGSAVAHHPLPPRPTTPEGLVRSGAVP